MSSAAHISGLIDLFRLVVIGLGAFTIGAAAHVSAVYLHRVNGERHLHRHVLFLAAGVILAMLALTINHTVFIVRNEPFHFGSLLFPPACVCVLIGLRYVAQVLAAKR